MARYPMPNWEPTGGWRVPPALVYAHTLQESSFKTDVISSAGARGLMQVRPGTAGDMARARGIGFAASELDRPSVNLEYGQSYLEKLRDMPATGGLLPKVIAAYNAGPTPVTRWNTEIRDNGDPLAVHRIYSLLGNARICRDHPAQLLDLRNAREQGFGQHEWPRPISLAEIPRREWSMSRHAAHQEAILPLDESRPFKPVNIALLTVSDTRGIEDDTSGDILAERITAAGHKIVERAILRDDTAMITSRLHNWIDDDHIDVVISTGGTGLTGRDVTPEALDRVKTKDIPGFGELFRWLSYASIGTSTIQSRACAVLARGTYIFALPGSNGAVKDGWDQILVHQLDSRHKPCNFVELMPRLREV